MGIKSSGVHVESKTGKANTDRLATFKFDRGDGQAVGADYDPTTGELNLHSQVSMTWRGTDPGTIPMKIEAEQLNYNEKECEGVPHAVVQADAGHADDERRPRHCHDTEQGNLKMVETTQAKGTDMRPGRNLEYAANQLFVDFNGNNQIQKITGVDQAHVVSDGRNFA